MKETGSSYQTEPTTLMKFSPAGLVMTCEEVELDMGKGIFMTGRAWLRAICCCANGVSSVGGWERMGSWGVGVTEGVVLWISAWCGVEQGVLVGVGVEGLGVPDPIKGIQSWGWDINSSVRLLFMVMPFLVVEGNTYSAWVREHQGTADHVPRSVFERATDSLWVEGLGTWDGHWRPVYCTGYLYRNENKMFQMHIQSIPNVPQLFKRNVKRLKQILSTWGAAGWAGWQFDRRRSVFHTLA